jgi:glycosyltransferase involved in cell wall biosynthesis
MSLAALGERQRVLVHDFAGHPFQVQLSRELARRGHVVRHLYAGDLQTPRGPLAPRPDDSPAFSIAPLGIGEPLEKYAMVRRWRHERAYGAVLAAAIQAFGPDVVLSANTPLGAQAAAQDAARSIGARFVFWAQDLLSVGIGAAVRRRVPVAGRAIATYYTRLERNLLAGSDAVVVIADDFRDVLREWRVPPGRISVLENWAPLEDMPLLPRRNDWAAEHGLDDTFCFLYAGTLGMKHNPGLLLALARACRTRPGVRVVVASEGPGADWLRARVAEERLDNLEVLGFQPFAVLPAMLASADVLLAVLEEEAGVFSVPSKVMSYLCAGRPIVAAVPSSNLAARLLGAVGAGAVVRPGDEAGFVGAALGLLDAPNARTMAGLRGRRYAEETFAIDRIAGRFEEVLRRPRHLSTVPIGVPGEVIPND